MSRNTAVPHISSANDINQSHGLLMTHSSSGTRMAPPLSNIRGFNFGARTMERSRVLTNNISSSIQPAISLTSLLHLERFQNIARTMASSSDSYIINVEDQPTESRVSHDPPVHDHHHQTTARDNFLNNIREAANEVVGENQNNSTNINMNNNNNNNNNTEQDSTERIQISPETRALIRAFIHYTPFVLILLAKGLYDHRTGVLNFIVLLVTFNHANNVLKREIAKQQNRSWMSLLLITCYIIACIMFINFKFETHIFAPYTQALTMGELLWSVLVTDFVLKLVTIVCKVLLTCLPAKLLALQKRGKYYLMVEATSQLYRCVAPVQPWLYYFFEAYQGPEQFLAVFFSVLYTMTKGSDLLSRVKLFRTAVWKLLQNVNLGVSPSKDQLVASGGICVICHEEYSMPVRLHCKHIFCETCVSTWLDRERSCPLCRASITDDPIYRDGHTTYFIQLY